MSSYWSYIPQRHVDDALDVVPLVRARLLHQAQRTAYTFDDIDLTNITLRRRIGALQHWLSQQGLEKGDRVAVMLANSPDHVGLILALILSGLVWVPINTRLRKAGLQYILSHAEPKLLVTEHQFPDVIAEADERALPFVLLEELEVNGVSEELRDIEVHHTDPLCVIYTSGTTGAPKGVVFTHRMMRIASEAVLMVAKPESEDRFFMWEPLCHIGGAQMLMVPFLSDTSVHIVERFSASSFWQQWETSQSTHLHYLGGVLDILVRAPLPPAGKNLRIKTAWGAGISKETWPIVKSTLKCEIRECYGMTECSSFATLNQTGKVGSIGRPLPWITVELLDKDGMPVKQGEVGEIVLSSDIAGAFLPGYLNDVQATRAALRDGKLHTGDLGRQDEEGDYYFVGRLSDSMRVRGENVSAWEVERVFAQHPEIKASAALGVKSEIGEQEILLYVQFKDENPVDWPELVEWARSRLASFQMPRYYKMIAAFETTPSGRIRKHLLARQTTSAWCRES